jgi:predicted ribosome quality control (RQC) complex YloA/Tae2 family protein
MEVPSRVPVEETDIKDAELATLLAFGETWKVCEQKTGFAQSTISRKLKSKQFRALVYALRRVAFDRIAGVLVKSLDDAAAQLQLTCSSGENENNRLRAAEKIIELSLKLEDRLDTAERLKRLEEAAGLDLTPADDD